MAEIHEFKLVKDQEKELAQKDLIADLERLLEDARNGVVIGIVYATVVNDGSTGTGWSGYGRKDMSFGISLLNHRYHRQCIDTK